MMDIKKIDDKDFVFINKPININDDKAFSDFLKTRKVKNTTLKSKKIKTI